MLKIIIKKFSLNLEAKDVVITIQSQYIIHEISKKL